MTDGEALLAAILDAPDDDTPRLVYADWLSENGDEARAEFIRVQVELAQVNAERSQAAPTSSRDGSLWAKQNRLRARERELFAHRCQEWFPNHTNGEFKWCAGNEQWDRNGCWFTRGLVSEIRLPLAAWEQHAVEIWSRQPVTKCVLTDRVPEPYPQFAEHTWSRSTNGAADEHTLPDDIFFALDKFKPSHVPNDFNDWRDYPAPELALDALSRAACLVGRQRVKDRAKKQPQAKVV